MAEHSKKLHIRKSGVVTDIKLYTTTAEVGSNYLTLKDGTTPVYAKLGDTTDANASALRVRKGGTTYAALTQAAVSIPTGIAYMPHGATTSFTVPAGIVVLKVYAETKTNYKYIGVTPGKVYSIPVGTVTRPIVQWRMSGNNVAWTYVTGSSGSWRGVVEYSPTINAQTVQVSCY